MCELVPTTLASCPSHFDSSLFDIPHELRGRKHPLLGCVEPAVHLFTVLPHSAQNKDFVLKPLFGIGFWDTTGGAWGQTWVPSRAEVQGREILRMEGGQGHSDL